MLVRSIHHLGWEGRRSLAARLPVLFGLFY